MYYFWIYLNEINLNALFIYFLKLSIFINFLFLLQWRAWEVQLTGSFHPTREVKGSRHFWLPVDRLRWEKQQQ